jgi:hypothetical protein
MTWFVAKLSFRRRPESSAAKQKAALRRLFCSGEPDYFEAALAAPEADAAAAVAELLAAAALEAASEADEAAAAGAGAGAAAGAGAGAGAGASVLLQAERAAAATRVASASDFFISGFLLGERL